ncbi:MAG TPA: hypothetical protein VHO72_02790 [Bacteroidales bacterium]|nr:hypothetical protein [Bacteroidales bacterium]
MRKHLVVLAVLLSGALALQAQDCTFYFPVKKGTITEVKSYNGKDKLTGSSKSKVLEQSADKIKFSSEVFDEKGKSLSTGEYEVQCKNGEYVIDMNSFLKGVDKNAYKDMDVKIEASEMTIPAKLTVGQKLNDGQINMKISNQIMTIMNMTVKILNRQVVSFEDITTPAGTFKCAKITYDVETKLMGTTRTKVTEWLSEKVGMVRSETYDQKGKLAGYSVLASISQ